MRKPKHIRKALDLVRELQDLITELSDQISHSKMELNQSSLTVTPAYGRDYKSKAAAIRDWNDGKDFIESRSNRYINKADVMVHFPVATVRIRYDKARKVVEIPPKKSKPG